VRNFVSSKSLLAIEAIHEGVREAREVSTGLPDLGMHKNRGIESNDILSFMHHGLPPLGGDISFELYTKGAVVIRAFESSVDLTTLKDESSAFGQRNDLRKGVAGAHVVCPCTSMKGASALRRHVTS
jgi:hypothetical protein